VKDGSGILYEFMNKRYRDSLTRVFTQGTPKNLGENFFLKHHRDLVSKAVQVKTIVINQYFRRIWRSMTWNIF
jgi:hypothetical protein